MDDVLSMMWTPEDGDVMALPLWPGSRLTVADILTVRGSFAAVNKELDGAIAYEDFENVVSGHAGSDWRSQQISQAIRSFLHSTALAFVALGVTEDGLDTRLTLEEVDRAGQMIDAYLQFAECPPAA